MFDENQLVEMKWINQNRKWYEDKGYVFNGYTKTFYVYAKDLMPKSARKIKAVCDYCGEEYDVSYSVLMNGRLKSDKDACCHCAAIKANELSREKRAKKYIGKAREMCDKKGYVLLTEESDYTDIKMKVDIYCEKHGKQSIWLETLLRGCGCRQCAIELRAKGLANNQNDVLAYINSTNGNVLLNPEDYRNNHSKLKIQCACGNIYETTLSLFQRGVNTCFSCSCKESSGEKIIREFLENHKITFEQEKRFDDCRDKKPLPFDFYLPEHNLIIEFDGQVHFIDIDGWSNHEITMAHDKIKNDYCKTHNIDLLRIPYWEGNNIEAILKDKLCL